jgi:hypothetical protein
VIQSFPKTPEPQNACQWPCLSAIPSPNPVFLLPCFTVIPLSAGPSDLAPSFIFISQFFFFHRSYPCPLVLKRCARNLSPAWISSSTPPPTLMKNLSSWLQPGPAEPCLAFSVQVGSEGWTPACPGPGQHAWNLQSQKQGRSIM